MTIQHLRSSTANKRPTAAAMSDGQLAVNTNATNPGLFFKDADGSIRKVGPVFIGSSAPNSSPATGGSTGHAVGEQWLDNTGGTYVLKIWDGTAWRSESGTFVNVSGDNMTGNLTLGTDKVILNATSGSASFAGPQTLGTSSSPASNGYTSLIDNTEASTAACFSANNSNAHGINFLGVDGGNGNAITCKVMNDGSAFFASNVGVGTTSPGGKLSVFDSSSAVFRLETPGVIAIAHTFDGTDYTINNNDGSSGHSIIFGSKTAGQESARIDASGRLLVGTSTSRIVEDHAGNGPQGKIQIEGTNSDGILSIISAGTADANRCGTLSLGRHRNSTVGGTPTVVQSGDSLGAICFAGGDGTDMRTKGAKIVAEVDGTPGANDMPGRLLFATTADGAGNPTERMRITNAGLVNVTGGIQVTENVTPTTGSGVEIFKPTSTSGQLQAYNRSGSTWMDLILKGNTQQFYTNGSLAMQINSAGRLGLGTTSPVQKLDVRGSVYVGDSIGIDNSSPSSYASDGRDLVVGSGSGSHGITIATGASNSGTIYFADGTSGASLYTGTITYNHSSNYMAFWANENERMRIDSSGRLLLGTNYNYAQQNADNLIIGDNSTSPESGITLGSLTASGIRFADNLNDSAGIIEYFHTDNSLRIATDASERMRITSNGYVQINANSSNLARLNFVNDFTRIENNTSTGHIELYTNNAVRNRFLYNGQGTAFSNQSIVYPTTDNAVDLGGASNRWDDVYATNGTIQTSDSRLKHEVETSVLGTDFVKALRPVSYKWIGGENVPIVDGTEENGDNIYRTDGDGNWVYESRAGARKHWGFIAQEVKQAVDDAGVDFAGWTLADKDDPDSTQSLRYEEFIAPLTKALQEAITKIETLEAKVAALEAG
nr:putative endosialidase [uncultured Mediterranean phage uvMED]